MSTMNKATQAERDFKAAMAQWKIVQQETADHKKGVFIDTDTQQNVAVVPTRMEYVRENGELRVTRIQQGNTLIYGSDSKGTCRMSQQVVDAFFKAQPQMQAIATSSTPPVYIPFKARCR